MVDEDARSFLYHGDIEVQGALGHIAAKPDFFLGQFPAPFGLVERYGLGAIAEFELTRQLRNVLQSCPVSAACGVL